MVKILERQGLEFGPDTNAQTGFDTTTYMLDLPKTDAEHIDTALFLFREVASEIKFDPGAVDRERGVILGEARASATTSSFTRSSTCSASRCRTRPTRQPPSDRHRRRSSRQRRADTIQDLYHRYYRPENATLVFVGDADPAVIEAKIKETLRRLEGRRRRPARRFRAGRSTSTRAADFDTFVDPGGPDHRPD